MKKNKYKYEPNKYINILPYKFQNRILAEGLVSINGPKLIDILKVLDADAAKNLLKKYPDLRTRINPKLKRKIYPSLVDKMLSPKPLILFGLLTKEEQKKYREEREKNLPWNKRKEKEANKILRSTIQHKVKSSTENDTIIEGIQTLVSSGILYNPKSKTFYTKQEISDLFVSPQFNPSNVNTEITSEKILNHLYNDDYMVMVVPTTRSNIKSLMRLRNFMFKVTSQKIEFKPCITYSNVNNVISKLLKLNLKG